MDLDNFEISLSYRVLTFRYSHNYLVLAILPQTTSVTLESNCWSFNIFFFSKIGTYDCTLALAFGSVPFPTHTLC